ncbi:MAG: UDP-N-acetyl-D-mannosamine transferase [Phycisphaerae bacterium]|nr:MAG: UDP-N-acetyl-D-mannosamine transferase [Phycisphaerae bacterium]
MTPSTPSDCGPDTVRDLFGLPVNALTMNQVLARVHRAIDRKAALHIGVISASKVANMRRNAELRDAVMQSDIILADGMSVVWASKLLRRPLPERVAGIDLMSEILRTGSERGDRVYCFGATDEVLDAVKKHIVETYPGIVIAGSHNGYFDGDEEPKIAEDIAASNADVLFVAMSSPMKEQFLARYASQIKVPVTHGVGGSFDVVAGKVKRAPLIWQKFGCEWLYRVLQEPGRMWKRYLVTNTVFMMMFIGEMFGASRRRRSHQPTPS